MEGSGKIFLGRRCLHINHGRPSPTPSVSGRTTTRRRKRWFLFSSFSSLCTARVSCVRHGKVQYRTQPPLVICSEARVPNPSHPRWRGLRVQVAHCRLSFLLFSEKFQLLLMTTLALQERLGILFPQMCCFKKKIKFTHLFLFDAFLCK